MLDIWLEFDFEAPGNFNSSLFSSFHPKHAKDAWMRAGAKYSGASNALSNFRKEAPNRVKSTWVWDCHLSATHMMMLMLIVGLLLSHGEALARTPEGLRIPFTQEFRELMAYMQGTEAGARIYRKVSSAQYSYNQRLDNKECPQRLFHIIKKKMKCFHTVTCLH